MPGANPNPNPNPNPKPPTLTLTLGLLGLGLELGLGMYDISSSNMIYLPVSHSIPLTIILRSAFCVLQNTATGQNQHCSAEVCFYTYDTFDVDPCPIVRACVY